ncbi:MAG: hypothetical protein WAL90_05310 [Desulfobacterales bacterium]
MHIPHERPLSFIPAIYAAVFRWLKEEEVELPTTPREALSGHLVPGDAESEASHLDGTIKAGQFSDDARLSMPEPGRIDEMKARLAAEQLSEFTRVRLCDRTSRCSILNGLPPVDPLVSRKKPIDGSGSMCHVAVNIVGI